MKQKFFIIAVILLFSASIDSQVAMGNWRTHFAYNTVDQVEQSENKVFAVSEGKLFTIDKRDNSIDFFSKINGLNGNTISKIGYDDANKTLLIIYSDGNIDFLTADGIKNLPDFSNKQMNVNKEINHILFYNNKAYLSTNFGVMVLNMQKMEIQDTYYIGNNASEVQLLSTTVHQSKIYANSSTDIYQASANEAQLINYEFWKKMTGLPGSGDIISINSYGDWLILLRGNKLYKQDNNGIWSSVEENLNFSSVQVSENYLLANNSNTTYIYDIHFAKIQVAGVTTILDGEYDPSSSKFWLAGNDQGVVEYLSNGTANFYKPNGPAVNTPYKLRFSGEKLFVVPGGRFSVEYMRPGIVMIFEDNKWTNIDNYSIASKTNNMVRDFMDIAIDPNDKNHFFVSSYGTGVYEFKNNTFDQWHNIENSTLETIFPNDPLSKFIYMRIDGGTYDSKGNLWFVNTSGSNAIKILKNDGKWTNLGYSQISPLPTLSGLIISNQNENQKWLLSVRHTPGVIAFDDNGTLENSNDDKFTFLRSFQYQANNEIRTFSPSFYYSIAQDKNGVMWIGTEQGPLIINNPSKIFEGNVLANRIIIPRNDGTGLGDFLLEDQEILSIAIDGANRKWIGTRASGVYLMSENGQETIRHFTTENSPLLSNEILSIAINPVSGEVYFGTSTGLISYQSDAAIAENVFKNVHAYPNPVRENYSGVITIAGLVDDTNVKITDTAGNLVAQTSSNGSIAIWDGKNSFGEKVSTGVYLAICVSPDGQQSSTTKILVIN